MFDGRLITIWSAPNYLKRDSNTAALMTVDDNLNIDFKFFEPAIVNF